MGRREIECEVAAFIAERTRLGPPAPDVDLVGGGLLDSLLLVELVVFVEERFGVTPTLDELDLDNFASLARIADFVTGRLGA